MKTTSIQKLQTVIAGSNALDLIGVRTPGTSDCIQVPGAQNVPLYQLDSGAILAGRTASADAPIGILRLSGARPSNAAETVFSFDFDNSAVVDRGTQAWAAACLPEEQFASSVLPPDRLFQVTMPWNKSCGKTTGSCCAAN